jgi:hypothetical protein
MVILKSRSSSFDPLSSKFRSVIVFSLQAAVTHGHDIGARDFFSRQQTRQKRIKGRKRIMEHATG